MEMQIKRSIEKIPGGMMLVPLFLGALCHTFSPGAGKYFGSFTNGMITGTVPILAVWFFCMGASIKLSATGTVLRKSGTLVVTKIAVALNFIDAPMQKNHTARMGTVPVIIPLVNDPKYFPAPGEKVWHSAPRNSGTSIIPPGIFSIERFICISITCRHIFKG